ncbi:MAG TPA: 4Fe-4S binding protein [Victivallales bacterium]|nr:4Fe-4S binding protein [Victivallales bacterium]
MSDLLKMCGTIFTSLKRKTACEMYPVKPSRSYEKTRGSIKIDAKKCTLCTLCDKRCPTHAIKVDRAAGYWQINRGQCILCKECVHACRPGALTMENQYMAPTGNIQIDKVDVELKTPKKKVGIKTEEKELKAKAKVVAHAEKAIQAKGEAINPADKEAVKEVKTKVEAREEVIKEEKKTLQNEKKPSKEVKKETEKK